MDINQKFHYHSISPEETAEKLQSNLEKGLSQEEVKHRREKFGENTLPEKGKKTALMIFLKQFKDLLIIILFIAAGISWYIGKMTDVYVILAVILFNAIMGFIQEYKAEKAIESIKKMVKHTTTVIRGGEKDKVPAKEVVPGDLIELEEGQTVPADARLIKIKNLQIIEASLTGESVPSDKKTEEVDKDTPVADRKSMVFKGTQVARGAGTAIVTNTAENTEIGKIATSLSEMEKTSSAFKGKTDKLAKIMAGVAISTAAIVFALGYFMRDFPMEEILMVTIATLVSSIPEGLPVVISIVLAIGAKRMAKENAIIREFTATEMLGSVTTILTDKTGTLTQSILTIKKMFINKGLEVEVSGKGYQLEGKITEDDKQMELGDDPRLDKMALIAAYCNNSQIQYEEEEEDQEEIEEEEEEIDENEEDDQEDNDDSKDKNVENGEPLGKKNAEKEKYKDDKHIKRDKKLKKDRTVIEDKKYREIHKTEEHHDERIEDGKRIIEDHVEETYKKIIKKEEEEEGKEQEKEKKKEQEEKKKKEQKDSKKEDPDKEKEPKEKQAEGKDNKKEKKETEEDKKTENKDGKGKGDNIKVTGDPTEAALLVLGKKAHVKETEPFDQLEVLDDLPFNSEIKFRANLVEYPDGKIEIFVVGAPEKMLELSNKIITSDGSDDLNDDYKKKIRDITDNYTENAMRVVALAYKEVEQSKSSIEQDDVTDLVWTGLTGIIDPPREGVKESIKAAKDAGIRVVMVTGDHKKTARSIAQNVGIIDEDGQAMTSQELQEDEDNFAKNVENINVFARVNPDDKLRIAKHLREKGELVGMTGDGVNDAPALKRADVGIAMGQRGTDVAKDSAEIVLSDDNFSTIVKAIEEGRIVFKNVRNTSFFLLTTNFASTMTLIVCIAIGLPIPLLATQILFVNMVTDGIMDVALATEPGHGEVMKQKPYGRHENILNKEIIPYMVLMVIIMVSMTIFVFQYYLPEGETMARTGAFITIAMTQVFNAFNLRTPNTSVFKIGIFSNKWLVLAFFVSIAAQVAAVKVPFLQEAFKFEGMSWAHLAIITAASSIVLWAGELYKYAKNKFFSE